MNPPHNEYILIKNLYKKSLSQVPPVILATQDAEIRRFRV
jgi:hypothetical protein